MLKLSENMRTFRFVVYIDGKIFPCSKFERDRVDTEMYITISRPILRHEVPDEATEFVKLRNRLDKLAPDDQVALLVILLPRDHELIIPEQLENMYSPSSDILRSGAVWWRYGFDQEYGDRLMLDLTDGSTAVESITLRAFDVSPTGER